MNAEEYGKKKRNKAVPAVYLVLITMGEILMLLRQNTGYQDGNWDLPSGHIEPGELPMQAIAREAKEEVGLNFLPRHLTLVYTSYRPQHDVTGDRIDLFFRAGRVLGRVVNGEPHKCAQVRWFAVEHIPENTVPHVKHALQEISRGSCYSELGLEWLRKEGVYKL